MTADVAYVALGANGADPPAALAEALASLDSGDVRVAACARLYVGPFVDADGTARHDAAPVWNTVAEVRTDRTPRALLERLLAIEAAAGRVRDGGTERTIDLDLLALGDRRVVEPQLTLPHPRCLGRPFVLRPWAEIAPRYVVPGTAAPVIAHADALPGAAAPRLRPAAPAPLPAHTADVVMLEDTEALCAWRASAPGPVGVVPTMGALHDGHLALVRRARAECASVLVTLFVNPLQFAPGEDLARYPRTLEADRRALSRLRADAVYVPAPDDLYPEGFATYVEPEGAAQGYEGAERPGHFRGVATVVAKLWQRTRPDRSYFGRKDAQQAAVLRQLHRDLDFGGRVVVCPTVRDVDGLALSSRNRYLDDDQRRLALSLSRALEVMARRVAEGETDGRRIEAAGHAELDGAAVPTDYLALVDAERMTPVARVTAPALAMGVIRVGATRLLDNRWVAPPPGGHAG